MLKKFLPMRKIKEAVYILLIVLNKKSICKQFNIVFFMMIIFTGLERLF
jgi:hypothetical protein